MTTPEKKVKDKVKKLLNELECYFFFPATGGFGASGVPDIIVCYQGHFIGIECKAGDNKPTILQAKNLEHIKRCGGSSIVVNEENLPDLRMWLMAQ
jgi:Holliday junction resolvase